MIDILYNWTKAIFGMFCILITVWLWFLSYVDSKAGAVEERVMTIRQNDMEHLDKRLNSIDNKLDILIGGRK